LRAGAPAGGDGRKPATARAEPNLRLRTQEDAGFARVRYREAGPSNPLKVRSTFRGS